MTEAVTIILPLPPAVLSPNRPAGTRGGRFARAAAVLFAAWLIIVLMAGVDDDDDDGGVE